MEYNAIFDKLKILAEAAKYDVSCASSGTTRKNTAKGIGSAEGWGICHSFTEDGRLRFLAQNHAYQTGKVFYYL
jgi:predicted DNA-binding helix-hairpin-helix protein